MFKILVDTEKDKNELISVLRKLHDKRHVDIELMCTLYPKFKSLIYLFQTPDAIEVSGYQEINIGGTITKVAKTFLEAHPEFTLEDYKNLNDPMGNAALGNAISNEHKKDLINQYVKENKNG